VEQRNQPPWRLTNLAVDGGIGIIADFASIAVHPCRLHTLDVVFHRFSSESSALRLLLSQAARIRKNRQIDESRATCTDLWACRDSLGLVASRAY